MKKFNAKGVFVCVCVCVCVCDNTFAVIRVLRFGNEWDVRVVDGGEGIEGFRRVVVCGLKVGNGSVL